MFSKPFSFKHNRVKPKRLRFKRIHVENASFGNTRQHKANDDDDGDDDDEEEEEEEEEGGGEGGWGGRDHNHVDIRNPLLGSPVVPYICVLK